MISKLDIGIIAIAATLAYTSGSFDTKQPPPPVATGQVSGIADIMQVARKVNEELDAARAQGEFTVKVKVPTCNTAGSQECAVCPLTPDIERSTATGNAAAFQVSPAASCPSCQPSGSPPVMRRGVFWRRR